MPFVGNSDIVLLSFALPAYPVTTITGIDIDILIVLNNSVYNTAPIKQTFRITDFGNPAVSVLALGPSVGPSTGSNWNVSSNGSSNTCSFTIHPSMLGVGINDTWTINAKCDLRYIFLSAGGGYMPPVTFNANATVQNIFGVYAA